MTNAVDLSNRPRQRHPGKDRRLSVVETIRTIRDNIIEVYPPWVFDKDYTFRRIGFQPFILVNRPDWIHEILVEKPDIAAFLASLPDAIGRITGSEANIVLIESRLQADLKASTRQCFQHSPSIVAVVLAMLLNPVVRSLTRLKVPRGLAVIVVFVGFIITVAAIVAILEAGGRASGLDPEQTERLAAEVARHFEAQVGDPSLKLGIEVEI